MRKKELDFAGEYIEGSSFLPFKMSKQILPSLSMFGW